MFAFLKPYTKATSWPVLAAMLALMVISLLAVGAAESADPAHLAGYAARQFTFALVTLGAFALTAAVGYQRLGRLAYAGLGLTLALLVVVFLLPPIRGCYRWIDLKLFLVQPSEIAKVTYVLALAWYLRYRENYRYLGGLLPPFLLTVVPVALIFEEPDLGTSLLLFPTLFFMLYLAGARIKHLLIVVAAAVVLTFLPLAQDLSGKDAAEAASRRAVAYGGFTWGGKPYAVSAAPLVFMKVHQLSRVEGWLGQWGTGDARKLNLGKGYQVHQSILILGSGGLTGHGALEDTSTHFRMLPEDQTDFIYAVVGGQWGFLGCVGVLLIYGVIFVCGAEIAAGTHDPFGRLVVVGVLALLFTQVFINVGMTLGLMPVTGMTLPLVSYGGSSMVVNGIALGLLVSVGARHEVVFGAKSFERGLESGAA